MSTDKKSTYFQYIDVLYSIDRIRFISRCSVDKQRSRVPETELLEHCIPVKDANTGELDIVGVHIGEKGRKHGFITKVEATACDDYFIEIIKMCDVGALSYLEVAQDLIFGTMAEAEEYGQWFEHNVQRRNKRQAVSFKMETTLYLGKEQGDSEKNYIRCYPRESKLVEMPSYHIEFVLSGAETIKNALGIRHYRELKQSIEMYYQLENKYLQYRNEGNMPEYRAFTATKGKKFGSIYISRENHTRLTGRLRKNQ